MTAPTTEADLGKILDQIDRSFAEFRKETALFCHHCHACWQALIDL